MSKFEFRNRTVKLDIEGNVFEIDAGVGEDLAQKKGRAGGRCESVYKNGEKTKGEAVKVYAEHINKILGNGAFEKIFAKRKPDLLDCMEVVTYVANERSDFPTKSQLTSDQIKRGEGHWRNAR